MQSVHTYPEADAAIQALSRHLIADIARVLERQRCYRWALAGGLTPALLYRCLAEPAAAGQIDWNRIHLFWGDERCVSPTHAQSNYRMVRETLLDAVPIPAGNIFPMNGAIDPDAAAAQYSDILGAEPLDLILLGMGDDGHTASLFPHTPHLREDARRVAATRSPRPPAARISLTLRTINAARQVIFLVLGAGKAQALSRVLHPRGRQDAALPAAMVHPAGGMLYWFLDAAAAAQLNESAPPPRP